jgi:hypothetical protein
MTSVFVCVCVCVCVCLCVRTERNKTHKKRCLETLFRSIVTRCVATALRNKNLINFTSKLTGSNAVTAEVVFSYVEHKK